MKIYHSINEFKPVQGLVVTIGTFDGVHLGHRKLIQRIVEQAQSSNGEALVLTFFPHPRMVLNPEEHGIELLSTTTEKIRLLSETGIDHLVVHPFSRDFSSMDAEKFVRDILVAKLSTKHLVIGYDHKFGNQRSGNISQLRVLGAALDFAVEEIPEQDVNDIAVSSTQIRKHLKEGRVAEAAELLGRPYELSGIVVKGNQIGRTIGFPTANIRIPESYKLIPAEGVYLVDVLVDGQTKHGMMSIGKRPTVDHQGKLSVEVHILGFDSDIYGNMISVRLLQKVRDNRRFDSMDELKEQLKSDLQQALKYFGFNH